LAHIEADLIRETATCSGTSDPYSLAGVPSDGAYREFDAVMANGDTCWYRARKDNLMEIGLGTFTAASPDTLARTTVIASSTGSAIAWTSGDIDVVMTRVSGRMGLFPDGAVGTPSIGFYDDTDNGLYRVAANSWALVAAGAKVLGITTTGADVVGLLDLSAATSGQVKFPATQNASGNPNTLDDYKEGTWTPALTFGGGATGLTYSTRTGSYTKIGNCVFIELTIALSAKGSSTGAGVISGLPFAVSGQATGALYFTTMGTQTDYTLVGSGTTLLVYHNNGSGSLTQALDSAFNNTSVLAASMSYKV
jgi:hypothetical protein